MKIQDAYKQKMAAQLKEWSAQISLLEAKVANAGADIRLKQAKVLDELRAKQQAAADKLNELEETSGEAWEQAKDNAEKIWEDLKALISDAHSKFK